MSCLLLARASLSRYTRYHTREDDSRHTSEDSIWHVLSSSITTVTNLSGDMADAVDGGTTAGVWFDLFGDNFAWSLTMLIAGPLVLPLVAYIIHSVDRHPVRP